eukprot:gb/GECG01003193.1/.p1 GENE.gb/GECG01003193.1/~~gb/GECG01003193.1/.p1  ORF type:complete len:561 (+),score=60.64 gb/GECG01003193.1/:1-1683(+)
MRSLEEGDFFIKQKLSPLVSIDFGGVESVTEARHKLRNAFSEVGVDVTVSGDSNCSVIFDQGMAGLRELWSGAVKAFPDYVSEGAILTVDEYDYPFRECLLRILRDAGENGGETSWVDVDNVGKCPNELREIMKFTQTIKSQHSAGRIRVSVLVTLLSLADIGLTYLDPISVARDPQFHGIAGNTSSQIKKALDALGKSKVEDAYLAERRKGNYGQLHTYVAHCKDDVMGYFVARYNAHQFCVYQTNKQIKDLEPLAAPCDVYHFLHAIGLAPTSQSAWARSWGSQHRYLLFEMAKKGEVVLDPLLGGRVSLKDITENVSFQKCYRRELGFESLVRLVLEFGYLRIESVFFEGDKRQFLLVPSSSIEISLAEEDIRENLKKNARLSMVLDRSTFDALQIPKEHGAPISENTFDYHLLWQLNLASENICNFTKKGYKDAFREYETQFITLVQLRTHWFHDDVRITAKETYALVDGDKTDLRLDMLIRINATLAAGMELKILHGSYRKNTTRVKTLVNTAWGTGAWAQEQPKDGGSSTSFLCSRILYRRRRKHRNISSERYS